MSLLIIILRGCCFALRVFSDRSFPRTDLGRKDCLIIQELYHHRTVNTCLSLRKDSSSFNLLFKKIKGIKVCFYANKLIYILAQVTTSTQYWNKLLKTPLYCFSGESSSSRNKNHIMEKQICGRGKTFFSLVSCGCCFCFTWKSRRRATASGQSLSAKPCISLDQYNPETKCQSVRWKSRQSPDEENQTKQVQVRGRVSLTLKANLVPDEVTENRQYYEKTLCGKERHRIKKAPQLWENCFLLHQNDAPAHPALSVKQVFSIHVI